MRNSLYLLYLRFMAFAMISFLIWHQIDLSVWGVPVTLSDLGVRVPELEGGQIGSGRRLFLRKVGDFDFHVFLAPL